ncbi:MAG: DUF86 domain-containing protein [Paludibacter sp.]|jgi:uncharacterized protein with HEPN domain|nr:DUF86 domain-containing protein [Paludibacter sp.]
MREEIRDTGRLEHILESINNLFEFTQNITFTDFQNDKMRKFAIVKNLEIIGEASYMMTKQFKEQHSEIEWKVIVDLRHVLVHGYYKIRNEEIWYIIQNDLPQLKEKIQKIYDS